MMLWEVQAASIEVSGNGRALGQGPGHCRMEPGGGLGRLLASLGWILGALGPLLWRSWGDLGGPERKNGAQRRPNGPQREAKLLQKVIKNGA